jgi:hypothetical protein
VWPFWAQKIRDERDLGTALVKIKGTSEIIEFKQTDSSGRRYGNITLIEFEKYSELKKTTKTLNLDEGNNNRIQYLQDIEDIVSDAKKEVNINRVEKYASSANKRINRAKENEVDRKTQAVTYDGEAIATNKPKKQVPQKRTLEDLRKEQFSKMKQAKNG